jgi:deoxyribose-phosphate aldolase
VQTIVQAGGKEVDVVLPYRALMAGQVAAGAPDFWPQVRACQPAAGAQGHH